MNAPHPDPHPSVVHRAARWLARSRRAASAPGRRQLIGFGVGAVLAAIGLVVYLRAGIVPMAAALVVALAVKLVVYERVDRADVASGRTRADVFPPVLVTLEAVRQAWRRGHPRPVHGDD